MKRPDIDAMKKRIAVAEPGPWTAKQGAYQQVAIEMESDDYQIAFCNDYAEPDARKYMRNAEFVAHARTDLPELIAYVEELEKQREDYELALEEIRNQASADSNIDSDKINNRIFELARAFYYREANDTLERYKK